MKIAELMLCSDGGSPHAQSLYGSVGTVDVALSQWRHMRKNDAICCACNLSQVLKCRSWLATPIEQDGPQCNEAKEGCGKWQAFNELGQLHDDLSYVYNLV